MNRLINYKLYGLVLVFITGLSVWLAGTLQEQRQAALDQTRAGVKRQVQLVGTGMGAFNAAISHLLDDVMGRIPENEMRHASVNLMFRPRTVPMLAHKLARTPFLQGLSVFDRNCAFVASGDTNHAGHKLSSADCNEVRGVNDNDQLLIRYVDADKTAMGNRLVAFSRNYVNASGQFLGGVSASIDLQFLNIWLGGHLGRPGETLFIATRDGRVLAQTGAPAYGGLEPLFDEHPLLRIAMLPGIESHVVEADTEFLGVSHVPGTPFYAVARLGKDNALMAWKRQALEASVAAVAVFLLLILLVRSHLRLLQQKRNLERLSITDELTGVYNRRHLVHAGRLEVERSQRQGLPMALVLVDADHFKAVNDRWGHAVGDQVLAHLAHRLAGVIRVTDVLARYGGEEFAVLLPDTDLAGAATIAERLRERVGGVPVRTPKADIAVTVSVGLAQLGSGETFDAMMNRADAALYQAKEGGRNRVVTYKGPKMLSALERAQAA